MTTNLIHDHHLRSFKDQAQAVEYAHELHRAMIQANWLILGAALDEQGFAALMVSIDADEASSPPFISHIAPVRLDGSEGELRDQNLEMMAPGVIQVADHLKVGATDLDWPLAARLAIQTRDYLDLYHTEWSRPDAGVGTLVIDADGSPSFLQTTRTT